MELKRITDDRMRISLSKEELEEWELDFDKLDYEDVKTRVVIWRLFDQAREELGFDVSGTQITVKAFPKRNGGIELYVSRREKVSSGLVYYLFSCADDLLAWYGRSTPLEKSRFRSCAPVGDGGYLAAFDSLPDEARGILQEYAGVQTGAYLKEYLLELREPLSRGDT